MRAEAPEPGIRLENVPSDRQNLFLLALVRLLFAFIAACLGTWLLRRPADAPGRWLLGELAWLGLGAAFLLSAAKPLCHMTRTVEFYENVIMLHETVLPLEQLSRVVWVDGYYRALGVFPLSGLPERRMKCYIARGGSRRPKRVLNVSERYYPGLLAAYDAAYEASLPTEFHSVKKPPTLKALAKAFRARLSSKKSKP